MWHAFVRILAVLFAFFCAALTGAATLLAVGGHWLTQQLATTLNEGHPEGYAEFVELPARIIFAIQLVAGLTIVPAIAAIVMAEVMKIRSPLYYICAGGAAAALMPLVHQPAGDAMAHSPDPRYIAILATAGFAAGFVYWLIAGRRA
jgi:hypothetical protein